MIYLLEKMLGVFWTRAVIRLRATPFAVQRARIERLMEALRIRRACVDATGIGMQLAEELQTKYGTWRVELVTFTLAVKEDLAVRTRRAYEDSTIRIPDDTALRGAIHAVKRIPTTAGNFRFDADRTEAGHADEFWAQSLGLLAGDTGAACELGMELGAVRPSFTQLGGLL